MTCVLHPDGHVCTVTGPHVLHSAWIRPVEHPIGALATWFDPEYKRAMESPNGSRLPPGSVDLVKVIDQLNTPVEWMSHENDDETSKDAAAGVATGREKFLLLLAYRDAGDEGLTDDEAAEAAGLNRSGYYPRRSSDLRMAGLIRKTGGTRESRKTGRRRMVCVIALEGLNNLNEKKEQ